MNEKEAVTQVYKDFCQALTETDEAALRSMIHRDCTVLPLTSIRQSAETFISSVTSGADKYYTAAHRSIDLRLQPCLLRNRRDHRLRFHGRKNQVPLLLHLFSGHLFDRLPNRGSLDLGRRLAL